MKILPPQKSRFSYNAFMKNKIFLDKINYYRADALIKVFYDLGDLQKKLEGLGFEVSVEKFGENFFLMVGKDKLTR